MGEKTEMLGFTKMQVLLMLSKRERSGYELISEIGALMGKKPSTGQIYPLLAKMKGSGYVEIRSTGARERKNYALTPKGRTALKAMIGKANSIVEAVLAEKLVECEHCGCMLYGKAHEKDIKGKKHYFCCASCAADKECKQCR